MYGVIIIGAGPAGLSAADRLREGDIKKVLVIDERGYAGGSAINDGKLNLTHKIGMDIGELNIEEERAKELIGAIDAKLLKYGADKTVYGENTEEIQKWVEKADFYGAKLIPARQRHLGTDNARQIWKRFQLDLADKNVDFILGKRVTDIGYNNGSFSVITKEEAYRSKFLIVAPGRSGSYKFREQSKKLGIQAKYGPIDVGMRVEVPYQVFEPITKYLYDPKFVYVTRCHGDKTRTFCTNPQGYVKLEPVENAIEYSGIKALPINGDAYRRKKSQNTNFAILHTIQLTEPDIDTTEFGRDSVISCYKKGGGKPLVQRWGDLMKGRRSKSDTFFDHKMGYDKLHPTLKVPKKAIPGDISLAYNKRTMDNLIESLRVLNKLLPGIVNPETILYAPEVKFYDTRYETTDSLETTIEKLFIAGDGAGKSRSIVGAMLTGILAAEGVLESD